MPGIGEGNGFLPQLQEELLRLPGDTSGAPWSMTRTAIVFLPIFIDQRNGILPYRAMVAGILVASYPRAIDPGDVHVIDLTEVQDCLRLGLPSRQFDGFSKPHHAIVAGQLAFSK